MANFYNTSDDSVSTVKVALDAALTANPPGSAIVGVVSSLVVPSNSARKGLVLINRSGNIVSLAFDHPAVLESGLTLDPYDVYTMSPGNFTIGEVFAIASNAGSNLTIQEYQ